LRTFPQVVSWRSPDGMLGELHCNCKWRECYHVPVLQRLLGPLDKKNQPYHHRQQWQSADGELLKRAAVKLKVEVPGVTYVAVLDGRKWVVCGTNGEHCFCSSHKEKGGRKPPCKHINWAQGKKPEVHPPQSLYPASPGDPDRGWAAIRPETPLPEPGEETALVCVECKLEHSRRLSPGDFQPCSDRSHTHEKVHMCTKACNIRPCMKGPGKHIPSETYPTMGGALRSVQTGILQPVSTSQRTSMWDPVGTEGALQIYGSERQRSGTGGLLHVEM
jgi:hypothetical protein